jgi:hypothetical protein
MEALKITIAGIWVFAVPGSSIAGGQWAAGDEPLYYIVSPKDVVVAKPRFFLFSCSFSFSVNITSAFQGKGMSSTFLLICGKVSGGLCEVQAKI